MSTEVALVAAFVATLSGAYTSEPEGYPGPGARIYIGQSVGYVSETVQGVGIEAGRWELQAMQQGNRNEGTAEGTTDLFSVTRVIRPEWRPSRHWQPVLKIGPAYVRNSPFVGRTNMHLAAGVEWRGQFSLSYNHYSSGGVHRPNTGLDDVRLAIHFPF